MNKTTLAATIAVFLFGGCAGNATVEPSLYDYKWSKPGTTDEDFKLVSHDCQVEEHQRTAYDNQEYQQTFDREQVYYRDAAQSGRIYWGGLARAVQEENEKQHYWQDCMEAHSWRIVDRSPIGHRRGPEGELLDYEEMGLIGDTNSFKPTKP